MKKNYLPRILSLVLSFSLLLSVCPNVYADESHTPSIGLNSFFKSGDDLKLTDHDQASHMIFVENMRNSTMGTLAMEVLTYIYDGNKSGEPDEAKYMEVLINIMKTYEMENATAISEQHKMDNLKSMEDYALEAMDIGIGLIPSFKNIDPKTQSIGDWIKIAMGGLSNLADNTNQWIEGLSNLETILQNYSKHDRFLALIAAKADGELRSAAANLRISLEKAVFVKLGTYADISNENFQNYTEFFFDDVFYEAVKLTDLYDTDSGFKFFIDLGANVNKLYTAAKLGAEIGKFIGNVAVNAEDMINRVLEMKAVYDISTILENELIDMKPQFSGSFSDETDKAAQEYAAYSNYLISGRIRGEYCMWSLLAKDSGLYSHFGDEKAMEAERVYNALTTQLAGIKKNLDDCMNVLVVNISDAGSHETVTPNSEWYVYDVNGETYTDYTLRVYEKQTLTDILMRYGSEDNDRSYTEYSVTNAEPLKLSLEVGYIYDFEFIDNANPDRIKKVKVNVTADDLGLVSVVDVETEFGELSNAFTYVAMGTSTAAITQSGDLYMWGMNDDGEIGNGTTKDQLTPQKIMTNISYVACNGETTAAIDWEGDLYMWGGNSYGTIGNGTMEDVYLPTKVLSDVKTVQLSATNVYALTNSGDLYAWGLNKFGYVGNGEEDGYQLTPYKVIENIRSIVYVPTCMFAISNDHNLYAWGKNDNGQLGTGTTINQSTPAQILSNVSAVCGNRYFAGAITISGELFMWGKNDYGQLGDGTTTDRLSPVKILTDVVTAEVSENKNTFAITSDNSLYVWGYNYYGQVGNGTEKVQNKPVKILTDVISATIGYSNVAAITSSNELYIWGDNVFGQIGDGKGGFSSSNQTTPKKVMENVRQVTFPSSRNVLAISLSGDLYSWGEGENGKIGNGKTSDRSTPVPILENVSQTYSRGSCMNAITTDGELFVWGYNMYGQMGTGSKKDQLTPYEIDISDICDDPIIQAEIQEMDGGIYAAFIEDGGYLPFIDNSGLVGEPWEYTVIDIDQDGTPELLLNADDGWGFYMTYIFSTNNTTQSIFLVDSIYSYAGISYSESNRCITCCYPKPTAMEGGREFFKLSDGKFILSFGIYYTDYDNYALVQYNPDGSVAEQISLTEAQWDDYVQSDSRLTWREIS